jgi:hypothetical protein
MPNNKKVSEYLAYRQEAGNDKYFVFFYPNMPASSRFVHFSKC